MSLSAPFTRHATASRGWRRFFVVVLLLLSPRPVMAQMEADYFGPRIHWLRDDPQALNHKPSTAIHATVLPSGEVFLIGYTQNPGQEQFLPLVFTMVPSAPHQPPAAGSCPVEGFSRCELATPLPFYQEQISPYRDSIFCSGHAQMADGRVFIAGGVRGFGRAEGLDYAQIFDPRAAASQEVVERFVGTGDPAQVTGGTARRWYPTVTRLGDRRLLVTTGWEHLNSNQVANRSVEIFDPNDPLGMQFCEVSAWHQSPAGLMNPDYTHAFVLPGRSRSVLMFGETSQPFLLEIPPRGELAGCEGSGLWGSFDGPLRPRFLEIEPPANEGASTVLLPFLAEGEGGYANGTVMHCGGHEGTSHANHIDFYDPGQEQWNPHWLPAQPSIDMGVDRHHPSTVLLPTGRVLVMAGHSYAGLALQSRHAQYLDPRNGFSLTSGSVPMSVERGYHTISVLLPDGRVLVGGGQVGMSLEHTHFEYYYPPYMSTLARHLARPKILGWPERIPVWRYGDMPFIAWGSEVGGAVSRMVLMGLPSMTHSHDQNQRSVPLAFEVTAPGEIRLTVPGGPFAPDLLPPGHYMLFLLEGGDAHGGGMDVPSEAKIVQILPRG